MNAIHPLAQTADTVTLSRADFERLLSAIEDSEDIQALRAAEAREATLGRAAARADHLPAPLALRLVAGDHPLRVWRDHRGLTTQALADRAGMARSYLAEIEGRKKPGSVAAYRRLAAALGVAVDDLLPAAAAGSCNGR